jgi:hypothetical protein
MARRPRGATGPEGCPPGRGWTTGAGLSSPTGEVSREAGGDEALECPGRHKQPCKCRGSGLFRTLLESMGDSRELSRRRTCGPVEGGFTRWVSRTGGGTQAPKCLAIASVNRLGTAHSVFEY